jgi:hypothetical protein
MPRFLTAQVRMIETSMRVGQSMNQHALQFPVAAIGRDVKP